MQISEDVRHKLEQALLPLHIHEIEFILYCRAIRYATIEKLAVQDGLPVCAVNVLERVDFTKGEAFQRVGMQLPVGGDSDEARDSDRPRRRNR